MVGTYIGGRNYCGTRNYKRYKNILPRVSKSDLFKYPLHQKFDKK